MKRFVRGLLVGLILVVVSGSGSAEFLWETKDFKVGETEIASSMTEWTLVSGERVQAVMATHKLTGVMPKDRKEELAFVIVITGKGEKIPETVGKLIPFKNDQGESGTIAIEEMRRTGDERKIIIMTGMGNPATLHRFLYLKREGQLTLIIPLKDGEKITIPVPKEVFEEWREIISFTFSKKEIENFKKKVKAVE